MERYNKLNNHLKEKFGARTLKICVDAGFTCPNRNGEKSTNGCVFCSARGSGEHLNSNLSITQQILNGLKYKTDRADKFIVYFQSFSNTYAPPEILRQKYNEAVSVSNKIVGLEISTRPDCINEEVVMVLKEFNKILPVTIELGLQTANETTQKQLNLCYFNNDFISAVRLLKKAGLDIVAHIMVGLPNESHADIVNTINFLNDLPISGIKIHSTYVVKNTSLATLYDSNKYTPLTSEEYLTELVYIITHLRADIVIHRITGDAPKEELVAPQWVLHKKLILNGLDRILKEQNLCQGMYYNKNHE